MKQPSITHACGHLKKRRQPSITMSTFWPRFSTVIVLSKRSFIGKFTLCAVAETQTLVPEKNQVQEAPPILWGLPFFHLFLSQNRSNSSR